MSKTILSDESLTFAEKVIGMRAQSNNRPLSPGEITVLPVDIAMAQDSTGPLAIKVFEEMGVGKVWDPSRIHLVIDHTYPAADEKVAKLHILMRAFAKKHLADYKVPREVSFPEDFPRDSAGKLVKRLLRDPYWAGHGRTI